MPGQPSNASLLWQRLAQLRGMGQPQAPPTPGPIAPSPMPGQGPQRTGDIYLPPEQSVDPKERELLRRAALLKALQR